MPSSPLLLTAWKRLPALQVFFCLVFFALHLAAEVPPRIPEADSISLEEVARRANLSSSWIVPESQFALTGPSTRIEFRAGSREIRLNGARVFLGDPVLLHRRQLHVSRIDYEATVVPILAPRPLNRPVRTIVIDAGHGGRDTGTRNTALKLEEKHLTLQVARRLQEVLEAQGYRVVMTRTDDRFVPLEERSAMANAAGADLFVSIHFNAVDNPAVHGTETYILTPRNQRSTGQGAAAASDGNILAGNDQDSANMLLGYLVHRQLLRDLGTFDRGLKRARFQVLRGVQAPAVLVEAGYLSNREEAARIATTEYQNNLVRALAIAINRYRQVAEATVATGQ